MPSNTGRSSQVARRQTLVNLQPVIPFSIGADWNLISRTVLPVTRQDDVAPGFGAQSGFGPRVQSFFFSPKAPTEAGLIWGVGPAFLIPTGADGIGAGQGGAGVTGVALRQPGPLPELPVRMERDPIRLRGFPSTSPGRQGIPDDPWRARRSGRWACRGAPEPPAVDRLGPPA